MRKRLNRSLSSVKSLAPCFIPLRVRHTSAYDFTYRLLGETHLPEEEPFALLDGLVKVQKGSSGGADSCHAGLDQTHSVKGKLAEFAALHAAGRMTS